MTVNRSALAASGQQFREQGISARVRNITISAIKEMPLLAARLGGCVSLGQGIPSFTTPAHILEAAVQALTQDPDIGKYTLGPGDPELRRAVAEHMTPLLGRPALADGEICITVGAMEGLLIGMLTLIDEGDEVILPSPNYASHIEQVILAGGKPVFVPLKEADWSLDIDALARAVTPKTRAIILCSPHNPTGAVFSEADLKAAAEVALEHGLTVIADETYDFLTFDERPHFSLAAIPELRENLLLACSFSKKYAMTGWRVGWIWACQGIMDHLLKVHDAGAICAPALAQKAALAALTGPQECRFEFREILQRRRDLACARLDELKNWFSYVKPAGAYYLMARWQGPDLGEVESTSMTLALRILNEAKVITIPGVAFGPTGEDHIRLAFGAAEEEINVAFDRLAAWCKNLQ